MKVRTNYNKTDYVVPGKLYEVIKCENYNLHRTAYVYLENNAEENNPDCIMLDSPCAHLNCEDVWEIVEE